MSSSPGLAEKRRLICCPCFPREGRGRRGNGVTQMGEEGGQMGRRKMRLRERQSKCKDLSTSFQNRPPNISLLKLFSASGWKGHSFPPLFLHLLSLLSLGGLFPLELKTIKSHRILTERCFNLTFSMHPLPAFCGSLCALVTGLKCD